MITQLFFCVVTIYICSRPLFDKLKFLQGNKTINQQSQYHVNTAVRQLDLAHITYCQAKGRGAGGQADRQTYMSYCDEVVF